MDVPLFNWNRAKVYLMLVMLGMVILIAWSAIELTRHNDAKSFNGTVLGVSIVSCTLLTLIYYQASCTFPEQA